MSHHHHHNHHHHTGNLRIAFFLNLAFTLVEIIGGLWVNSVAILSDAVHDFGDSLALGCAWFMENYAHKGRDKHYSYGYGRYSVLGAIITSIMLILGAVLILIETIPRIVNPSMAQADGMIILAILGLVFNGAAVLRLSGKKSLNEKAIRLHLMEDVLGWIAVLVGAVLMYYTNWIWIDPVLAVLISFYILYGAIGGLKSALKIIMQSVPDNLNHNLIEQRLLLNPEIKEIQDIHSWTMDGEYNVLTLNLIVKEGYSIKNLPALKKEVKSQLKEMGVSHTTIEIETENEICEQEDC